MVFVIDASVTLAWCFEDEATPLTEALLDRVAEEGAAAPALWEYEVSNALLVAERRRRISEAQAARLVELMQQLPVAVDRVPTPMPTLLAVARQHDLSTYDAAYLAMAERRGLPLATLDTRLRAAAGRGGVATPLG